MNQRLTQLFSWAIALALPFFLVLSTVYIFMSDAFVRYEYSRPDFPAADRFTAESRYTNSIQTLHYVLGQTTLQELRKLGVYNEREVKHLVDVRQVTAGALTLQWVAGLVALFSLIVLLRAHATRGAAYGALTNGGILTIATVGAIGLFSVFAFDEFFVTFHHVFFEGDSWLFLTTDSLIQFYPEPFWQEAALGIALMSTGSALFIGLVGWLLRRPAARALSFRAAETMAAGEE